MHNHNLTNEYMDKPKEECGVFGIVGRELFSAGSAAASSLLAMQHRGQEGAGIAYFDGDKLLSKKNTGLVTDIFKPEVLKSVPNTMSAIGHVRYSTTGTNNVENTQPITSLNSRLTFAVSHNGNLTNSGVLRQQMVDRGIIFHTTNDSEIINKLIIGEALKTATVEDAIENVMGILEGAYCVIVLLKDRLIAFRDKNGFRPLCMGTRGTATVFASESCGLESIGATFLRDIEPGEIVTASIDGTVKSRQLDTSKHKRALCVFELIYFARLDSNIDGQSVYKARLDMGRALARQRKIDADMVCGVPDSGLDAAYGYHLESGLPYSHAFVKNRYTQRSFIVPDQEARANMVNMKLNPLRASIEGKRVVLVDDSIVRGTTSANIISSLKRAGAKEVHMCISCPPFTNPCYFGVDIDSKEKLIANQMSIDEICKKIGADSLTYLELDNLVQIKARDDVQYCSGCFTGDYPIALDFSMGKNKFDDK